MKRINPQFEQAIFHLVSSNNRSYSALSSELGLSCELLTQWNQEGRIKLVTNSWITNSLQKKQLFPLESPFIWSPMKAVTTVAVTEDIIQRETQKEDTSLMKEEKQKRPSSNISINYDRNWNTTVSIRGKRKEVSIGDDSSSDKEEEYMEKNQKFKQSSSSSSSQIQEMGSKINIGVKQSLACQRGAEGSQPQRDNLNVHITTVLDELATMHKSTKLRGDVWRVVHLNKVFPFFLM